MLIINDCSSYNSCCYIETSCLRGELGRFVFFLKDATTRYTTKCISYFTPLESKQTYTTSSWKMKRLILFIKL